MHPILRRILLAAIGVALVLVAWDMLSPGRRLAAAQRSLLEAVSSKDAEACAKLVSESYADSRGWTHGDWEGLLSDLRVLAPSLQVNGEFERSGDGVLAGRLEVKALGPAAGEIQRRVRQVKAPTEFRWRRESWTPWSWRLLSVENPDLDIESGYRPGRFGDY